MDPVTRNPVLDRLSEGSSPIVIDRSRCLRMRYNGNDCGLCREACSSDAVGFMPEPVIRAKACSGCMLCTSACPMDALRPEGSSLFELVERLKNYRKPVLGCERSGDDRAHVKTSCLGFLSTEHLIGIPLLLGMPIQINLTSCHSCPNSGIVPAVKKRLDRVRSLLPRHVPEGVIPAEQDSELTFEEEALGRREFFQTLKTSSIEGFFELYSRLAVKPDSKAYGHKEIPRRRRLLGRAISRTAGKLKERILGGLYFSLTVNRQCDGCGLCSALCPTGAVRVPSRDKRRVHFNAGLCAGCGLCEDVCETGALHLSRGFHGREPFQFQNAAETAD